MALLVPVVTPAVNSTGIEISVSPTAIFSEAIDEGSVLVTSCFIAAVKHGTSSSDLLIPPNSIQDIISGSVIAERWHLTLDQPVTTVDFGNPLDATRGKKYRTKITIDPDKPLDINTNYLVILSKDLTKTTVFDPELLVGAGTGVLFSKGVYKGLIDDTYTITITNTGVNNSAKFVWTRVSDGYTSNILDAKERFIDIDQGIKIEFGDGSFVAGNSYRIRVIPVNNINDFFAWVFSTGASTFQAPEDENSNEILNLPVAPLPPASLPSTNVPFYITKITPPRAATLLPPEGSVATLLMGGITFVSNERGREWNEYSIELISGGSAGFESVSLTDDDIEIQIEDGVSTEQQVVDAFNLSGLVNGDFTAATTQGTISVDVTPKTYFKSGEDDIVITIEFNKDIDPISVTKSKMKVIAESLVPGVPTQEIAYDFVVVGNKIIITPI